MDRRTLPPSFVRRLKAVSAKRPRTVIQHILRHGHITTEELQEKYGYEHPPRAARDVREQGIPLETFRVKNAQGRSIGAYRFGDPSQVQADRLGGRQAFAKDFKQRLVRVMGCRCSICLTKYEERYLQVDHRVPYEVSGDAGATTRRVAGYLLLCGSCNRAKSWSCEHCVNWTERKSKAVCRNCYWANPESYKHVALRMERRLDVAWTAKEVREYDRLKALASVRQEPLPAYVKGLLRRCLGKTFSPRPY